MIGTKVTIVSVNYNSSSSIVASINALNKYICEKQIHYIIVDNSADRNLAEILNTKYPDVQYYCSPGNIGYGQGCNIGLKHVETQFCLLLNPDAILDMSELTKMLDFMEVHSNAAFLGPCIHEPNGQYQNAGGLPIPNDIIRSATGLGNAYTSRKEVRPGDAPFKTDWLCAAILLVRMKALNDVGFFDPRFFLYFEETDLCRRLLNQNWEIWATGMAEGYHLNAGSSSSSKRLMYSSCIAEHYFKSRFYYMVKHHGWIRAITADVIEYFFISLKLIYTLITNKGDKEKYKTRLYSPLLKLPEKMEE